MKLNLHRKSVEIVSSKERSMQAAIISIALYLFMLIFEPFDGREFKNDFKHLILLGYSVITFTFIMLNDTICNLIKKRKENDWKISHQIVSYFITFFLISMSCALSISLWFNDDLNFSFLLRIFYESLLLAVFPILYLILMYRISEVRKKIPQKQKMLYHSDLKNFFIKRDGLSIGTNKIVYIKACGKYSEINFYSNKNEMKKAWLRISLNEILSTYSAEYMNRIHRSYIVNTYYIKNIIKGKSYHVKLENDEILPVSRTYQKIVSNVSKISPHI